MKSELFADVLARLGIREVNSGVFAGEFVSQPGGAEIASVNPATGETIARVRSASRADYERAVAMAQQSFESWRLLPPPRRGEVVRQIGGRAAEAQGGPGAAGHAGDRQDPERGAGEVQEMIDMCDFAVGLSRQLYGLTIASERPQHRMIEQWHPLGPIGIITAFNFPVAVWAWNAMLAAVCGDTVRLEAVAPDAADRDRRAEHRRTACCEPHGLRGRLQPGRRASRDVGESMADDARLPLISATGSCRHGRARGGQVVGGGWAGRCWNSAATTAVIVDPSRPISTWRSGRSLFAAVGTAGQRCTTLRRLIVHESIADAFVERLGRRLRERADRRSLGATACLMGPLIHEQAVEQMLAALDAGEAAGRQGRLRRRAARPARLLRRADDRSRPTPGMPIVARGDVRADPLRDDVSRRSTRRSRSTTASRRGSPRPSSPSGCARPSGSCRPTGRDCGIANVNIGTSRRGDRRGLRRREGHRRRSRGRVRRLEGLHAAADLHDQLRQRLAPGAGREV